MAKKNEAEKTWAPKAVRDAREAAERRARPVQPLITKPPVELDRMGDADIERVLKAIIFFDARRVLDEEGNGLPLSMLDDATALGLAGFEVEEVYENGERGEPRINVGIIKKFKQADRARAAETLWKKQGKMGGVDEVDKKNRSRLDELERVFKSGPIK